MALADTNFLRIFVSEHRERIEELLSDDPDLTNTDTNTPLAMPLFLPFRARQFLLEHVRVCTGAVVGRCGGGPKEMYLYLAEIVRISSPTKSQWDNPRQSHGGVTDGN